MNERRSEASLIKIAQIGAAPVSLDEFKAHALIDDDDQDGPARIFLAAAIEHVGRVSGVALSAASYQLRLNAWPHHACWPHRDPLQLPLPPVREVRSVSYVDADGIEHDLDAGEWAADITEDGADLTFTDAFTRPAVNLKRTGCVRVNFDAGYDDPTQSGSGSEPRLEPEPAAKLAVLMLAKAFYENRDAAQDSESYRSDLADRLLGQIKVYR